jgi:endoglucanase
MDGLFSFFFPGPERRTLAVIPARSKRGLAALLTFLFFFHPAVSQEPIKLNQLGFYPSAEKIAIVPGDASGEFYLLHAVSESVLYTGQLHEPNTWPYSDETVAIADFSEFTHPGVYIVEHPGTGRSHPFEISEYVHNGLSKGALRAYYYNRASIELKERYAGPWARPLGHPDTNVQVHPSAATTKRPAGTIISSPKGWYDAGDFNKYIVNSGISTYTLLAAYEHFPGYYDNLPLNIPETGNHRPDILNEAKWNLDWMLAMQDPDDGGVYHKLTHANFPGIIMPHNSSATRYVVQKSTAAALNFAAVMAVAARVYEPFDAAFASQCLAAAENAWVWAVENPTIYYNQNQMNQQYNPNINTGEYGDTNVDDEFDWAAAELYITTLNDDYWHARNFPGIWHLGVPSWQQVRALAFVSLAHNRNELTDAANVPHIVDRLLDQADALLNEYESSAYRISMGHVDWEFLWGSNGMALNHSVLLIQAYRITEDEAYLRAAQSNLDYILGRNPTGYSFVTGFGSHTPMDPHHRQSAADNVADPVPGFVVGGPNTQARNDCGSHNYPSDLPALSYVDDWCSYSTNEVAINWNAALAYTAGALESIMSGNNPPTHKKAPEQFPLAYVMKQNYPNPFNPVTTIEYYLPVSDNVLLRVFDVLGREVAVLVDGRIGTGRHRVIFDASGLPSGVYMYTLSANDIQLTGKMLYLK